jgi:hypothetical protein
VSGKSSGYLRLVDACAAPGCPVCRCLEADSRRHLTALLYEHVTDVESRRRLRASWGLCNWHTWMLLDVQSMATGAAIVYADLVALCQRRVERLRDRAPSALGRLLGWLPAGARRRLSGGWFALARRRRAGRRPALGARPASGGAPAPGGVPRLAQRYRQRSRCPVCDRVDVAETHYVETLVRFAGDPELGRAYGESAGLCLPHVVTAVERCAGHPGLDAVLRTTVARWGALRRDLEGLVAKHDHRSTEPPTAEEADSHHRAFEALAGRPHVFGPDRRAQ